MEWDQGPAPAFAALLESAPLAEYAGKPDRFRLEWGPIYYRGRTDGSARVLLIGQDPAADEDVARRILVGDAGQRVQGLLAKLGLTRSYVMVNASLYSATGQFDAELRTFMDRPAVKAWRNQLLDALLTPAIEAVVALGQAARHVTDTWPGAAPVKHAGRLFQLVHPTARPDSTVMNDWNSHLAALAAKVAPDPDGVVDLTPYAGTKFAASALAPIPPRDLAFGAPALMGRGISAARFKAGQAFPDGMKDKPAILWIAIEPQG